MSPRRRRKKDPNDFELDPTRLGEMSESELVHIARKMGHPEASRQLLREDLEGIILGEITEVEDPLADIRERMFAYVEGNRRLMRSLLDCTLHCPTCPHNTVVACYTTNSDKIE